MTVGTLKTVEVELKVTGINPNGNSKFKTAGGLHLEDDSWVNVAEDVDMKQFKFNHVNIVKRLIKEDGNAGNIVELISIGDAIAGRKPVGKSGGNSNGRTFVDNSKGQREGAIGHYTSRLVSAFIVLGKIDTEEAAVESFIRMNNKLSEKFGK